MQGQFSEIREYGGHVLDKFEFESGVILEDVAVEYVTLGEPKFDEEGNIINSVVFFPNFGGNQNMFQDIIPNSGFSFKKKELFYIMIHPLGLSQSCSPSTSGLKMDFPKYTFKDRVNFQRQFLLEKFNITKVFGVIGEGLGGYDVFTWACEYPYEMEIIIILDSSYATSGIRYIISKSIGSMIESSEFYYSNEYSSSLTRIMVAVHQLLFSYYAPRRLFKGMSNDEIDVIMDEYVGEGLFLDIYDFKLRNDCILNYDVKDKLGNIKAKSLFISTNDNVYFNPRYDIIPLKELVEDSEVFIFESKRETLYAKEDFSEMVAKVDEFIEPYLKKLEKASRN